MSTPGDFGTNEKKPLPNLEDFCPFATCSCICWPFEHQTAC